MLPLVLQARIHEEEVFVTSLEGYRIFGMVPELCKAGVDAGLVRTVIQVRPRHGVLRVHKLRCLRRLGLLQPAVRIRYLQIQHITSLCHITTQVLKKNIFLSTAVLMRWLLPSTLIYLGSVIFIEDGVVSTCCGIVKRHFGNTGSSRTSRIVFKKLKTKYICLLAFSNLL